PWFSTLGFSPATHPLTTELVVACFHVALSAVMHFKDRFSRVRPWDLADLNPPIDKPKHPADPSGHSTQLHWMALLLAELVPDKRRELRRTAKRVAVNGDRAGVHSPSDTTAGQILAERLFRILTTDCALFKSTLEEARNTEWSGSRKPDQA